LQQDPAYAIKAMRIAALARDISEVVVAEQANLRVCLEKSALAGRQAVPRKLAFHAPCTLQHGLKLRGGVEAILQAAGCELTPVADAHLCCGAAGTYALLQPEIAGLLRDNKLAALQAGAPLGIASANVGCIAHLQANTQLPVKHWVEWLDEILSPIDSVSGKSHAD
jgi:glycolate oxidase iron-sulfur subunit